MPEAAADLPKRRPGRFQFTIRGLLAITLGVAVGLSALSVPKASWTDPLLAAAVTWIVLGLVNQARDLRRTYRSHTDLTSEERFGCRFAAFWRVAVALMLVGLGAVNYAYRRGALAPPETDLVARLCWDGGQGREVLFCFLLLIVLSSVPHRRRRRSRGGTHPLVAVFAVPAVALFCLIAWTDKTEVTFLVHVAATGIEHSHPSKFALAGVDFDTQAREFRFFFRSLPAVGTLALGCLALWLLARQWQRGLARRALWGATFGLGLGATAYYSIWVYSGGLGSVSPWTRQSIIAGPLSCYLTGALVVLLFVTVTTYRITSRSLETSLRNEINWRRNPATYYQEKIAVLALLAGASAEPLAVRVIGGLFPSSGLPSVFYRCFSIWEAPFILPSASMLFLVCVLAIHRIWAVWWRRSTLQPAGVPRRAPGHFFAVWLATLATVLVAIPTIAWFSFAVWLSPWYMIRWP